VLKKEAADRQAFYWNVPMQDESAATVFDSRNRFHNPFQEKEK
jgi:hypothetical protein